MKKWIGIDQLRLGMRVENIDRPWYATPFLRHRIIITSSDRIDQLKACGVQTVEVSIDQPDELAGDGNDAAATGPAGAEELEVKTEWKAHAPLPTPVPFEEELPAAKQVYKAAKAVIQGAMQDVRMGRAINMEAVHQVVAEMTESVFRNPDALTSLSRLKRFDEYTFYHSVNTSLLAMSLGRELSFSREELHQIGVGTLLHDIGKIKIPVELLNKPGRFEPHEMEMMKQHVMRGVEVLSETTGLQAAYLKPALEHHERVDGSGYPFRRAKDDLSRFGLIAAVVDIYDAVTSDRCYHKGKTAHETLQLLYRNSQTGHLDHTLVQRFIQVVGVYPVGTVVELNTGERAVVSRVNRDAPLEPLVRIVKTAGNTLLSNPLDFDLRRKTGAPARTITAVSDPRTSGVDPSLYLDKESA